MFFVFLRFREANKEYSLSFSLLQLATVHWCRTGATEMTASWDDEDDDDHDDDDDINSCRPLGPGSNPCCHATGPVDLYCT